jgi:hypothetical protein
MNGQTATIRHRAAGNSSEINGQIHFALSGTAAQI